MTPAVRKLILLKGVGFRGWMWATGVLRVSGLVDNTQSFAGPWMWLSGNLAVGGVVDNSQVF